MEFCPCGVITAREAKQMTRRKETLRLPRPCRGMPVPSNYRRAGRPLYSSDSI